jgi:hypothetical protein
MVPAAMTLMLHALDFADKTGLVKVNQQTLVQATHQFGMEMFKRFNITPAMIQTAATKVHAIANDPAQSAKLKQLAGVQ